MERKLRLKVLIGVIVIAAVVIGVLAVPEPKEARADNTYTIFIYYGGSRVPLEGLTVWIWFSEGEVHRDGGQMTDAAGGLYTYNWDDPDPIVDGWEVQLDPDELAELDMLLVNPDTNPSGNIGIATTYREWELVANPFR